MTSPSPVRFQSFSVGAEEPIAPPAPTKAPATKKFRAGQGAGGGAPKKGCFVCHVCKASRKKKAKVDPTKCLTNAAAAPAEAVEVKLLKNSAGFASALEKGASTRSQDKRVRRQVANMGDQDWVDRVLKEEKPSVQHLVGRRDRAYNEAWWKEYKRLEGVKAGRMREMLQAMREMLFWKLGLMTFTTFYCEKKMRTRSGRTPMTGNRFSSAMAVGETLGAMFCARSVAFTGMAVRAIAAMKSDL